MNGHLTQDQIDACVIGTGSAEERGHLAGCGECAARMASVTGPLGLFREAMREALPEQGAMRPVNAKAPARGWRMAWATVAFVVLLVAAAVPVYRRAERQRRAEVAAQAEQASAQDDALLREVESEVSLSVPPPMQKLELLMASDTENSETTTSTERVK